MVEDFLKDFLFPDEVIKFRSKQPMKFAEGTDCTFTGNFFGARILKRFSCETGITLETIRVNQVR